jgi:hypothetical protein
MESVQGHCPAGGKQGGPFSKVDNTARQSMDKVQLLHRRRHSVPCRKRPWESHRFRAAFGLKGDQGSCRGGVEWLRTASGPCLLSGGVRWGWRQTTYMFRSLFVHSTLHSGLMLLFCVVLVL